MYVMQPIDFSFRHLKVFCDQIARRISVNEDESFYLNVMCEHACQHYVLFEIPWVKFQPVRELDSYVEYVSMAANRSFNIQ